MDKRKLRFERCKNAAKLEALKKIAERKEKATAGKAGDKKAYNSDAAPSKRKKPKIDLGKELEGKPKVSSAQPVTYRHLLMGVIG